MTQNILELRFRILKLMLFVDVVIFYQMANYTSLFCNYQLNLLIS